MTKRITIILGHRDARPERFCSALAASYMENARSAGQDVRIIKIADLDISFMRTYDDFYTGTPCPEVIGLQNDLEWAEHWVLIYPLWLGEMPALLKAFFEQTCRPTFAFNQAVDKGFPKGKMNGRSARIIVTMGMPAIAYKWFYGAFGLRALERSILGFIGIRPIEHTIIGGVTDISDKKRQKWLSDVAAMGRAAK
jgi:putative NADPH-quinone reductase